MKQYFCDELNNVLTCFHDRIGACCSGQIGPVYIKEYRGEKIDWKAFKEFKYKSFEMLSEDKVEQSECRGCYFLRERKPSDVISPVYKMINVSNWTHCNCGCIYCARMLDSKGKITYKSQKSEYFDMVPLLKQLYKQELLDRNNLVAVIQGGDISVLKEFEDMVKCFLKNGVKDLHILTNNIVYQPIIQKLMDLNKCILFTSLDCADAELYYKMKRVDKYKDTVENLRRYAKGRINPRIVVKFILVEHMNDSIEQVQKFVDLMADIGIKMVEFTIDNKWAMFTNLDEKPLPAHYGDIYLYFKKACEERNIKFNVWEKTQYIIDKYALKKI